MLQQVGPGLALAAALALLLALARKQFATSIAPFTLLATLCYVLLLANTFPYYAIMLAPAYALLAAEGIEAAWSTLARPFAKVALVLLALGCVWSVPQAWSMSQADRTHAFEGVVTRMRAVIEPGSTILGPQTYWFGLRDHRYLSWEQLVYHQRFVPGTDWHDALLALKPDVFVIDEHMRTFIVDQARSSAYAGALSLPARPLQAYLAKQATVVLSLSSRQLGRIMVFRLHWEPSAQAAGK